ncbi:MAG: polymer-forming cytoskeletal protein [Sulfurimonas sp.]
MALLRAKKNKNTPSKITSATIITSCMEVTGNLHGSDTVHIDGKVTGDIIVSNTLVIGKSGVVYGEVKAKNAIINGKLEGSIVCETLEVMETGEISKKIQADTMVLDGTVTGNIIGINSIEIQPHGKLTVEKLESKQITVSGSVKGNVVASELLDIRSTGSIEGEISVKTIKTAEGSRVVGTMSTYQKEEKNREEKAENA